MRKAFSKNGMVLISIVLILCGVFVVFALSRLDLRPNIPYFYIDKTGKKIMDGQGYYGDSFHDGLALVCDEYHDFLRWRTFRYIDRAGKTVVRVPSSAITAYPFSEGLAAIGVSGGRVGYIDTKGKWAIEPKFSLGGQFSDGLALIKTKEGCPIYIDRSGQPVINTIQKIPGVQCFADPDKQCFMPFSEGLAAIKINSIWRYIDKSCNFPISAEWNAVPVCSFAPFCEGLAPVGGPKGNGYYIDSKGSKFICNQSFLGGGNFSQGLAPFLQWVGSWGYMDRTGKVIIAPQFQSASVFSEGLAAVEMDGKVGYIDRTGSVVIPPQFAYGGDFSDGVAVVIPFIEHDTELLKPDLIMWGKPTGKYFARLPIQWIWPADPFD